MPALAHLRLAVAASALGVAALMLGGCHAPPPAATTTTAARVVATPSPAMRQALDERASETVPCFEHAVAAEPLLSGHAVAELDVRADGSVAAGRIVETSFGARQKLHACLVDVASRWRLPPPDDGRPITVRLPLSWEGGCRAPAGRGCIQRETVRMVIRAHLPAVQRCYQDLLATTSAQGRIVVQFTIGPDGRVARALVSASDLGHPPLDACVVAAVETWRFPRPAGGGFVVVSHPFELKTAP